MRYIIIFLLILGIVYIVKSRRKIKVYTLTRPIFTVISLGLFLVLFLIIYRYSPTFIDFIIVCLISILFHLNIRLQGLCTDGLYLIKGTPFLSQFIGYKDIKNIEIVNKKSYFILQITAFGSYFNLDFKKEDKNMVKNTIGKYKKLKI